MARVGTRGAGLSKDIALSVRNKLTHLGANVSDDLARLSGKVEDAFAYADGAVSKNIGKHNARVYQSSGGNWDEVASGILGGSGAGRKAAAEFSDDASQALAKHGDEVSQALKETGEQVGKHASAEFGGEASQALAKHGDEVNQALKETGEQAGKHASAEFGGEASEALAKHGDEVSKSLDGLELGSLNRGFSKNVSDDLAGHTDEVSRGLKETAEANNVTVKEVPYGEQFTKGVNGRKELLPNIQYVTEDGYRYSTDEFGRISKVEVDELVLKKGTRNAHSQRVAGREDRVVEADTVQGLDDGGHLIGTQFNGSGDLDNLVAMNRDINRSGGEWFNMEKDWAKALKETPPKKVTVNIEPIYSGKSLRPDSFDITYKIEGKRLEVRNIKNQVGG